jgi:hypothetical protein
MSDDEFPRIGGQSDTDDGSSITSVIRSPPPTPGLSASMQRSDVRLSKQVCLRLEITYNVSKWLQDIDILINLASKVRLSADVRGYLHDVVIFLRMHRAVAGGVSAMATRHLYALIS